MIQNVTRFHFNAGLYKTFICLRNLAGIYSLMLTIQKVTSPFLVYTMYIFAS